MIPFHFHYDSPIIRYAIKVSPVVGGASILATVIFYVFESSSLGIITTILLTLFGLAFGVFTTLGGMLYHQHGDRITILEKDVQPKESRISKLEIVSSSKENRIKNLEDNALPRRESEEAHKALQGELNRVEEHLRFIDAREQKKKYRG